jgi:hypothetical protein
MRVINYQIHAPTILDFLKVYMVEVLGIEIQSRTMTKEKEEKAMSQDELMLQQNYLIEKMTIYLAKMSMHDHQLAAKNPSLLAVGSIYVALKICE